jgi:hypothetical protein
MNRSAAAAHVELAGLDGANPLGFLAALGALATVRQTGDAGARLAWKRSATWVPVLHGVSVWEPRALSRILNDALRGKAVAGDADSRREEAKREFDAVTKAVKDKLAVIKKRGLRRSDRKAAIHAEVLPLEEDRRQKRQAWLAALKQAVPSPELAIGQRIDCTAAEFRDSATGFLADVREANRQTVDLLAAFGSDACVADERSGRIVATPFCFITGSGHQYFLDTVRQLMKRATPERIHAALFEPWTYRDETLSMRWDPLEDRRYALMDRDPTASDNKSRTVWMANLLAYRALVFFPSAPSERGLATTAWRRMNDFTWPMWEQPADSDTIRSLLQLSELGARAPDRSLLRARGVAAAFRARRIRVGKPPLYKINFGASGGV